jgi:hypothetical protein
METVMTTPALFEVLEQASKVKNKDERAAFLKQYDSKPLRDLLKAALDPNVKWNLPEGTPPFKRGEEINSHNVLSYEMRKIYIFIEGYCPPNINKIRREQLFIQMLESVHPKDADLLIAAKDKKLPYKGITADVVNNAFPGLV